MIFVPELNIMRREYITTSHKQTQKLGEMLAEELRGGEIICLTGELGSGKTTFAQGILKGLEAKGPFTSPTFVVMKKYQVESQKFSKVRPFFNQGSTFPLSGKPSNSSRPNLSGIPQGQTLCNSPKPIFKTLNIYHIDCYRVKAQDILELGWKEIIANKNNVVIVEWAEKIRRIIPKNSVWIKFEYKGKSERKISMNF